MKKIKILGAGPAGLTAAINLSMAGYDVEVFEKNPDCGARFHGDLQGLENWSTKKDILDELSSMNINTNFDIAPFKKVTFTNCTITEDFSFNRPLLYLVKRGTVDNSLDQGLKQQALAVGAKIFFNTTIEKDDADIDATGPQSKKMTIFDKGITFETNLPDMAIGIVNKKAAFNGYSYLLIVNGYACLCCCVFGDAKKLEDCFEFTKEYFVKNYQLIIQNERAVGGVGCFSKRNVYQSGKTLFVGESAGLQDFLAGFGMRTAITSGYLAAKSIIEDLDYTKLANNKFERFLKAGIVNRFTWEHKRAGGHLSTFKKINKLTLNTNILRSIYNFNLIERLEYPRALKYIKTQYPEITL